MRWLLNRIPPGRLPGEAGHAREDPEHAGGTMSFSCLVRYTKTPIIGRNLQPGSSYCNTDQILLPYKGSLPENPVE